VVPVYGLSHDDFAVTHKDRIDEKKGTIKLTDRE